MSPTDWDPLKELVGIQERMNKLFESALVRTNFDAEGGVGAWSPVADVYETPTQVVFSLELPGLNLADIDLKLEDDDLLVYGERKMQREEAGEQFHRVERSYGKFARRFRLPSHVDRDSVAATYRDGVVTVALSKRDGASKKPIRVTIR